MSENPQLDLAFNYVAHTNKNIFLTGKAGTGKTTFLHHLKKTTPKRMAIVAPTGVAAINAGGVTIHSFFQLPFGPYIPQTAGSKRPSTLQRKFSNDKINLIRSLDLLVIDEISMVRADTLDGIDEVLRRYKNPNQPFGGLQLLMIGDLHQLSPVIKDDEWQILQPYYPNIYFFSSHALLKSIPVSIELKHIYRQSDTLFIELLNSIRNNQLSETVLNKLNERYIPNFSPSKDEGYITLTTHNYTAQSINDTKLAQLKQDTKIYTAIINGDFDEKTYPTLLNLELKLGAQVMFVKNDPTASKQFYNGKIGKITRISYDVIHVQCPNEDKEIAVTALDWTNIKFTLNTSTKQVEEQIMGSFTQFPLKLAWAITIHKSQGLTFDKAIIDANLAFAFGQVYVALSRCKSFEGMVLRSPIIADSVKTSTTVSDYTKNNEQNPPSETHLMIAKIAYQQSLLLDLIDFSKIKYRIFGVGKLVEENYSIFLPSLLSEITFMKTATDKHIYAVASNFKNQLNQLFKPDVQPELDENLQTRVQKASAYFSQKLDEIVAQPLIKLNISTDNTAIKKSISEAIEQLKKEVFVKITVLKNCIGGFSSLTYLQSISNAEIDYLALNSNTNSKEVSIDISNISHGNLYKTLTLWRNKEANEKKIPIYMVLSQKSLLSILEFLPANIKELEHTKGIGKSTANRYGKVILDMVNNYCTENKVERGEFLLPKIKIDTKQVSFDLFKAGKTIQQIATERNLATSTIQAHLAHYILDGKILVTEIMDVEKLKIIMAHYQQFPDMSNGERKIALGETISYPDLKAVSNHIAFTEQANHLK
ncbi:MAG: helicase [Sphingobacteriales bacterium]|nr:MAG: helicase [Sphingobacteriales bacterium]TAF80244.1 MAG: helicase [Sphingobacteriales bacterium]